MKRIIRFLSRTSWIQHPVFWVLSFYMIGSYFSVSNTVKFIDFYYALFFHVPIVILVYMNLRLLIPFLFQKEYYAWYVVAGGANMLLAVLVHHFTFEIFLPLLPTDYYIVSFTDMNVLLGVFFIYWLLSSLIKLSKSWYLLQALEKENLSLELNVLKAQVNPHFLFNSLNSIYSLAIQKSDLAPDVILRLSGLLRYMIYEVSDQFVPLKKEVGAIKDYLDLQRLRVEYARIDFRIEGDIEPVSIAPLLFVPIIENSFKHGLKGEDESGFVDVLLEVNDRHIVFDVTNSKGRTDDVEKGRFGGVGLENVKKRLILIYGEKANLTINDTEKQFSVSLKIQR